MKEKFARIDEYTQQELQQALAEGKIDAEYLIDCIIKSDKVYNQLIDGLNRLNNKYEKALDLLNNFDLPCEKDNFNIVNSDYCQRNCTNDNEQFKKCWDKFIEWKIDND